MSKKEELFYRLSQGRPHLLVDMRIVNDEGNELPHDGKATGELQVRGPHVMKSYFRVSFCPLGFDVTFKLTCELPAMPTQPGSCLISRLHVILQGRVSAW